MDQSKNNITSMYGTATPYLALFDGDGMPVMNTITGIPLGAYITQFSFKYDEEKENQCLITFDTGNPDTVDIPELQENQTIIVQWGYILPNSSYVSGPLRQLKVKDFNATFDSTGTHVSLVLIDGVVELRHQPPMNPVSEDNSDDGISSWKDYLDSGFGGRSIGIVIEKFDQKEK